MRAVAAGCFVFAGLSVAVAVLSAFDLLESAPPIVMGAGGTILLLVLCGAALWLFNAKGTNPLGVQSRDDQLHELRSAKLLETESFAATRAFRVEEYEDEGLHYYIELTDGRVLFLSGQYLYDFEPIADDRDLNQQRRFPCTEFTILRHKTERYVLDILCNGEVFEPEITAPPFGKDVWRDGAVPRDGAIFVDLPYETLKAARLQADEVG